MPVPQFPELYNGFIKAGFKPKQASIKAHAVIRAYVEQERGHEIDSESDEDEDDSRRVISRELEKMKLKIAKLSNHYKQDKKLPLMIKYISKVLKNY